MCDPTGGVLTASLIGLAISAVSAVATQDAQRHQVNQQQDALYAQAEDDANTRRLQMSQVSEAAAQQANERNRAARAEAASFDTISGEFGGGVSSDREAAAIAFTRQSDLSDIQANKNRNLSELGHEGRADNLRYQATLASLNRPSTLATGLKIAGAAANAYGSYAMTNAKAGGGGSGGNPGWDLSRTQRGSGD